MKTLTALLTLATLGLFGEQSLSSPHYWLKGDLLIWKGKVGKDAYTNKASIIGTTFDFTKQPLVQPHSDYDLGSRVEFGTHIHKWDFALTWTRIKTSAQGSRSHNEFDGTFPVWGLAPDYISGDFVLNSSENWSSMLNLVDVMGSYVFKLLPYFTLTPAIGVRSAWIDQEFAIHYSLGIFPSGKDKVKMRNDFWGIGPRVSLDPSFKLCRGLNLMGSAAVSALGGYYNIKQKESYLGVGRFERHEHPTGLSWVLDFNAALQWSKPLYQGIYDLSLQVGWEWHRFYKQNLLPQNQFHLQENDKNLTYLGWFLSGRLCF